MNGGRNLAVGRADELAAQYCVARRGHFGIVLRQVAFSFLVQAVAGTLLLGLGGYLVISGQMTLGQLVAAELIVTVILGSFTKIGKHLESFYDLLAAVDKLGKLYDLPVQPQWHSRRLTKSGPANVELVEVRGAIGGRSLRCTIPAGTSWAVLGSSGKGKTRLLEMIAGQEPPASGYVLIDNRRVDHLAAETIAGAMDLIGDIELFTGTLEENLCLGRPISSIRLDQVLEKLGLVECWRRLDRGGATEIGASGEPLSQVDKVRMMLARSLLAEPRLLLIDGLLDRLADQDLEDVLRRLSAFKEETTFIFATGRQVVARWADQVLDLNAVSSEPSLANCTG
jgi:putative ABC transport system ATP-binding protein